MQLVFLSIFNVLYMCHKICCDRKSEKFCKIFWEVNTKTKNFWCVEFWWAAQGFGFLDFLQNT